MLIIWTSASTADIKKTFGPVISRQSIQHKVETNLEEMPIMAEGDVLLACGTRALATITKLGLAPKNRTVTSLRDGPLAGSQNTIFCTFDPGIANKDYARFPEMQWDCQLAVRQHQKGTIAPRLGKYRWVESYHELIERIEKIYAATGQKVPVSADLETLGLDEYDPEAWIISCFFTVDDWKADGVYFMSHEKPKRPKDIDHPKGYWEELWVQFHWLFTSGKIALRGANWKFDSRWIFQKWDIDVTNLTLDTVLVGSLLDENRSNSLKLHAKIYTELGGYDDELDSKYDKARMDLVPQEVLLTYAGGDTDVTQQTGHTFKKELLKDRKLIEFYTKILHPSSKVFEKLERTGVCVDVPYYESLRADLGVEIARLDKEMKALIPHKLKAKYSDNFSLTRPALLNDFLFTPLGLNLKPSMYTPKPDKHGKPKPSTAMEHLSTFKDDPEASIFISLMEEKNSATKTLSTFVDGFLKHLRSDGKFHPHYILARTVYGDSDDDTGAVTGRTACKDPAMQTYPKHTKWAKRLRRAIIPPPGMTILQIDYSQGELKITACLANEPVMLKAYQNGADLHAITAAQLNGYEFKDFMLLPEDTRDELRSGGKAGNFGLIYGMGAEGFVDYAWTAYGVKLSLNQGTTQRDAFFDLYNRLPEWHEEGRRTAKRWGHVRSPLGRIRHLPLINSPDREARAAAERQAINSPVQSCLSDMMQYAMVLIDREYGSNPDLQMWGMTHDACAFYVPEDDATIWAKRLKAIMDNLPLKKEFGWDHQLQFTTDAEICTPGPDGSMSFAYLKKLKGL